MQWTTAKPQNFLRELFELAVAAASPHHCLQYHLPTDTRRRAIVIGAGKAAASMASALEQHWEGELAGLVVTRYGHSEPCQHIQVIEASHPVPNQESELATRGILQQLENLTADDLVICLLSGGGSALLSQPAPGISLATKQYISRQLLACGAPIEDINCVRKHLSAIKGGRLALACMPAQLLTLAISDVAGDNPAVIASGPTLPDSTTPQEAMEILQRWGIKADPTVLTCLQSPHSVLPGADHPAFARARCHIIASAKDAQTAAANAARSAGLHVVQLGDAIVGESRQVAKDQAALAQEYRAQVMVTGQPCLILSGGETTVTIKGRGLGGRNSEFLLALAAALQGTPGIYALAADTDGIDGSKDNAGALLTPATWQQSLNAGLDGAAMLADNNAYGFFDALDGLLISGPTRTNVNDFRAILILPDA